MKDIDDAIFGQLIEAIKSKIAKFEAEEKERVQAIERALPEVERIEMYLAQKAVIASPFKEIKNAELQCALMEYQHMVERAENILRTCLESWADKGKE